MKGTVVGLLLAAVALSGVAQAGEQPEEKIKTLLVTGRDVNAHKWRETSPALRKILEESGKFNVVVCEDPRILESKAALQDYDLLVLNYYNWRVPTLSDTAKENFAAFIRGGKGFVTFHLSSASFAEWKEFRKMCGRNWVMGTSGHGPFGEFKAQVIKEHPITKGVPKEFATEDELYAKLQGDEEINVLVSAYSDFSKKVEPLAFTLNYGEGRVYHHAFGHVVGSIENPPVAKLFAQGSEWAATGKVE
jgi:type 1 glutamine amidotransferase